MEADDMDPDENERVGILGLDEDERADGIDEVSIDHELDLEQSSIQQLLDDTDRFLSAHTPAASPAVSPDRSTRRTDTGSTSDEAEVAMRSEAGDAFETRFGLSGSEARDEHVERLLQDTNSLLRELDHTTARSVALPEPDSDEHSEAQHESLAAAVAASGYGRSSTEPHQRKQHRPTSVPLQWPGEEEEEEEEDEDTEDDALESERVKNTEKSVDELMQKMRELCSNDDKLDDKLGSVERSFGSLHSDLRRSEHQRYDEVDDAFAIISEREESGTDRLKGAKQTTSVAIDDEDMELRDLNRLLVRCGFGPVGLLYGPDSSGPTKSELVESLKSVLTQFEEQGVLVQNMLSEQQQFRRERLPSQRSPPQTPFSEGSSARHPSNDEFLDSANQSLQIRLRDTEEALRRLRRESDDERQSNRDQLDVVQKRLRDMRQKATQAEHQLRKKDELYAKVQKKLDQFVRSREERRQKDAALFEKMFKRKPRTSSAKDSATLEMLSAFEAQRVRMQDEIDHLTKMLRSSSVLGLDSRGAAEVELEQRVNTAATKEAAADFVAREELQRLKRRSKQDLAQMQEQVRVLKEDRDNLRLELQARPSMKHYKDAKKQIEKLSAQLVEARNLSDLRKHLSTTELIRRDKDIHRLRLNRLDHLPSPISKEILQDVCRELGVDDVSLVLPALRKVCSVVRTAPSLKRFIHQVVSLVLPEDRSEAPWDDVLDRVQTKLKVWKGELHRLDELDELRRRILNTLRKRAQIVKSVHLKQQQKPSEGPSVEPGSELIPSSDNDIISVLDELVDCEQQVLDSSDAYAAADAAIKQQPELLFHKIIAHFCHLFDCKETAAIFPTMNRLFLTVQEQSNFIRCVRSTLRLEETAALSTCASALQQLTATDPDLRLAGDAPDFECVDTMHKLKQYLGCDKAIDIVDTCRKLKDRCDLYNGLFPRIDKTLQSLFELLDVKELEHIVPCVRRLVYAQR